MSSNDIPDPEDSERTDSLSDFNFLQSHIFHEMRKLLSRNALGDLITSPFLGPCLTPSGPTFLQAPSPLGNLLEGWARGLVLGNHTTWWGPCMDFFLASILSSILWSYLILGLFFDHDFLCPKYFHLY